LSRIAGAPGPRFHFPPRRSSDLAGRTEVARMVFGAEPPDSGSVTLDGRTVRIRRPSDAIDAGIGYLTESRKTDGLALQLGVDKNITMAKLPMWNGLINLREER